ncbi:hypothetical protein L6019_RS23350 [Escherichia coli]|nr:hypothetical protein [Escherichia coli]EKG7113490.1 hypothetical protein [Escherichia coli]ELM8776585.1 hypothetical protein [Escherichia coli]EMA4402797.1 hypothetical protein [Escherichia coli]HAH8500944.1 hypothetical protein [Escherichia coli]
MSKDFNRAVFEAMVADTFKSATGHNVFDSQTIVDARTSDGSYSDPQIRLLWLGWVGAQNLIGTNLAFTMQPCTADDCPPPHVELLAYYDDLDSFCVVRMTEDHRFLLANTPVEVELPPPALWTRCKQQDTSSTDSPSTIH